MKLQAGIRIVGGYIFAVAMGVCHPAAAACLVGNAHQTVVIHVKRLNKDVVFDIPEQYPVKIFGHDSFIISFSYPSLNPRPIDAGVVQPAARLIVYGGAIGEALAEWQPKHPPTVYQRTEDGIDIYQGTLGAGSIVKYYFFRDSSGNPVLFDDTDIGRPAVGYMYTRRLRSGVDLRGVVSQKVGGSFRRVDADIARFIENMICGKE